MGEINKLIDVLVHPLAEKDKSFIIVDGVLHALNERNPPQSLRKFIKYDLPEILKKMKKTRAIGLDERAMWTCAWFDSV